MTDYGVTKYDPLTGCWPSEAVGEDGKVKQEWIDCTFYVDGKPWEPANTETERIANRVCDRYGVGDRVGFYRNADHPENQQFSVREFLRRYSALIAAIALYVLIMFSAFEAANIF